MKIDLPELSDDASDLLAYPRPLREAAMKHADSSEHVIDMKKAYINTAYSTQSDWDYAASRVDMSGIDSDTPAGIFNKTAKLLSFWIEECRFRRRVQYELGDLRDALEAAQSDIAEALEALETILD